MLVAQLSFHIEARRAKASLEIVFPVANLAQVIAWRVRWQHAMTNCNVVCEGLQTGQSCESLEVDIFGVGLLDE